MGCAGKGQRVTTMINYLKHIRFGLMKRFNLLQGGSHVVAEGFNPRHKSTFTHVLAVKLPRVLCCAICLVIAVMHYLASAQEQYPVITAENAEHLRPVTALGDGLPVQILPVPNSAYFILQTTGRTLLYNSARPDRPPVGLGVWALFSPNGRDVFVVEPDGSLSLKQFDPSGTITDRAVLADGSQRVNREAVAFSPDGTYLAYARGTVVQGESQNRARAEIRHELTLVALATTVQKSITTDNLCYQSLRFDPKSTILAIAGSKDCPWPSTNRISAETSVAFYNVEADKLLPSRRPGGTGAYLFYDGSQLSIYNGQRFYTTGSASQYAVRSDLSCGVRMNPRVDQLAICVTDRVFIINPYSGRRSQIVPEIGEPLSSLDLQSPRSGVLSIAYAPDGERLAMSIGDGTIRVWSVDGVELALVRVDHIVWSVGFTGDGSALIGADDLGNVQVWPLTYSGDRITVGTPRKGMFNASLLSVGVLSVSPDSVKVAVGSREARLVNRRKDPLLSVYYLWTIDGSPIRLAPVKNNGTTRASFSSDSRYIAMGGDSIYIWDTQTRYLIDYVALPNNEFLRPANFVDYGFNLSGSDDQATNPDRTLTSSVSFNRGVGISGSSQVVLSTASEVRILQFSPDGRAMITGGLDGVVWVWRVIE